MIKKLIVLAIVVVAVIVGLSVFLQPDDLKKCNAVPSEEIGCQSVDAIVVVSGGDTTARTKKAIELYKNGWAQKIIFSGAAKDKNHSSNAVIMQTLAIEQGVPTSDILIDELAETTAANAKNVSDIFLAENIKSAILVTSGYHQRRVWLEFNRYAPNVRLLNCPLTSDKDWSIYFWWMNPRGWWLAIGEMVKIVQFFMTGPNFYEW